MKLPFTTQQFLDVFRKYNEAVYPIQLLFVLLAALLIFFMFRKSKITNKATPFILAAFWLWMGAVYHIGFFAAINKAAYGFGALFLSQGILLLYFGLTKAYYFAFRRDIYGFAGSLLILYALVIYPVIGQFSGHGYPYAPTFGLPCPTTIFTFGIFLLSRDRLPFWIFIVPIAWSVIGFSAAFVLGIKEDTGLIVSGLAFLILNLLKPKKTNVQNESPVKQQYSAVRS